MVFIRALDRDRIYAGRSRSPKASSHQSTRRAAWNGRRAAERSAQPGDRVEHRFQPKKK